LGLGIETESVINYRKECSAATSVHQEMGRVKMVVRRKGENYSVSVLLFVQDWHIHFCPSRRRELTAP